jgi:hypothetical protein
MNGRSLASIARTIQSAANRRDLLRQQQDRDQILSALHAGTGKGDAAVERFAAAQAELARLEDVLNAAAADMRNALDDLTLSQGKRDDQTAPKRKKKTP